MSRSVLTRLLDKIYHHSTFLGKIWLTLLIVVRIVLTAVGGETVYNDEQSGFVCSTEQPGCEKACYDASAPLSHIRFWVFQVIVITTPSIMYLGFAMHKIARMDDNDHQTESSRRMPIASRGASRDHETAEDNVVREVVERSSKRHYGQCAIRREGLMTAYMFHLLLRAVFELSFLIGQYFLYGLQVSQLYQCISSICLHTVHCFVSRPTEKTIFLLIMYAVSSLGLLCTVSEILHLGIWGKRDCLCTPRPRPPTPRHPALASQRSSICCQPSAPPGYHTSLKSKPTGKMDFRENLGEFAQEKQSSSCEKDL